MIGEIKFIVKKRFLWSTCIY